MKKAILLLIEKIEYEQKINRELIVLFEGSKAEETVFRLEMLCRHNSQRLTELNAISKLSK
jgi:hypothetical protein